MNPTVLASQDTVYITFMASILIWVMLFCLLILWVVDGKMRKEQALHAIFAIIVAWSVSYIIKSLFPTLRPFYINGNPPLTLTIPKDSAFPSEHETIAFAMAVSVFLHNKKVGLLLLIGAIFVGIGRLLGNVHYFVDIIGGAFIGSISAIAIKRLHLFKAIK